MTPIPDDDDCDDDDEMIMMMIMMMMSQWYGLYPFVTLIQPAQSTSMALMD